MAPEDQRRIPIGSAGATTAEADASNLPHDTVDKGDPKSAGRTEEANQKSSIGAQTQLPSSGYPNSVPPGARAGGKTYTVQVGAFSHPGIAQQWAMKWKGRGYEVSLKPVARPSGVIYRLYLGSFSSESQADELVRHLKSKEGISALRLVLHN
jgi:cell division septation protein DedD